MKTTPDDPPAKGIATVRNVDHYGVSVPDMDQAIAFYTEALGADLLWRVGPFHETPTGAEIDQVEIAMLRLGPNLNVELLAIRAPGQNRQLPATTDIGAAHLAFFVDDLEAAGASVAAQGGTMLGQPVNTDGEPKRGERIWYFKTPWGAFMELLWRPAHLPYEQDTTARLYGPRPRLEGMKPTRRTKHPARAEVWRRWTAAGLAWAALLGTVACVRAQQSPGQFFDPTGAAPERPASEPPAYNILRYEEDYSYLRDSAKSTDWLDPLKFIPLDADGRVYLTLGGDMRQRFEHFSGFGVGNGSVDGKADSYYLARYLLHADLHAGDALRFFFQVKSNTEDGRRGGPRPNIDRDDFDVHQAFLDVTLPLGGDADKTSLLVRLGRQELAYGDDRLIDIREGPNVRQSFDAARVSLQNPGFKVDALYARQVATNKGVFDDGYDLQQAQLWGVYSTLALPFLRRPDSADLPSIDLYYLGYDRQRGAFDQTANLTSPFSTPPQPGHETRHSLGGRLHGTVFPLGEGPLTGEFHYNVEGLYQFGRFGDASISAYEASFDLGYYFQRLPFGPNLSLRVDLASGDGNGHDRTLQTFNPLFPKGIYFSEPGSDRSEQHARRPPRRGLAPAQERGPDHDGDWLLATGHGRRNLQLRRRALAARSARVRAGGRRAFPRRLLALRGHGSQRLAGVGHQPSPDLRLVLLAFLRRELCPRCRRDDPVTRRSRRPEL